MFKNILLLYCFILYFYRIISIILYRLGYITRIIIPIRITPRNIRMRKEY